MVAFCSGFLEAVSQLAVIVTCGGVAYLIACLVEVCCE